MSKKRSSAPGEGGQKKTKQHKWTVDPAKGIRALLITCDQGKEMQSAQEMVTWAGQVAETLFPPGDNKEEDEDDTTVSSSLEQELKQLKQSGKGAGERFAVVSGLPRGIVMLHVRDRAIDPCLLASAMLKQMLKDQAKKSRFSARLLPLTRTCFSDSEDLKTLAAPIITKAFEDIDPSQSYAVVLERRGGDNARMDRDTVIKAVAAMVPASHPVDLANPDVVILVEVIGRTTGISVIQDWIALQKYSIRAIQSPPTPKPATTVSSASIEATPEPQVSTIIASVAVHVEGTG